MKKAEKCARIIILLCFYGAMARYGFSEGAKAILLHHSTGGNLYNEGHVAQYVEDYNDEHGTDYEIAERAYPTSPYPWHNYPYDWWNLWVTENEDGSSRNPACDSDNPNIECLSTLTQKYNAIIMKQCFPGSDIEADTGNPDVSSSRKSLENYKAQYRALRREFDKYPDNLFIVWTLVPRHRLATTAERASRAKEFVDWVKTEWLTEDGKSHPNIKIFDFWGYVAESNPNPENGQVNTLKYEYERSHTGSDSHPNTLANQTVGPIFAQQVIEDMKAFFNKPKITSVSINADTITIEGENFGKKDPAKPIVWADFENGDIYPSDLGQRSQWSANDNLEITSDCPDGNNSQYCVVGIWQNGEKSFSFRVDKTYWSKIYHYQKRYLNFDTTNNQKAWRLWPVSGSNDFVAIWREGWGQAYNETEGYIGGCVGGSGFNPPGKNEWHTEEFIWQYSGGSGIDACNNVSRYSGIWDYTRDGVRIHHRENVNNGENTQVQLRTDNYTDSSNLPADGSRVYMDDIYIDDTYARVMIGDKQSLSESVHREIQIPTTWTGSSITAKLNQGTFNTGDRAYIFVVDEYNNVSEGYPITIGQSYGQAEDVNGDGQVNINDVQLVVNIILGNATNSRADVNGDGRVDVSDVQEIVNAIVD